MTLPDNRPLAGGLRRRTFLQYGLGGAALVAAPPTFTRAAAWAQPADGPFGHGVASGDPAANGVILWTRVTPSADATPGSGLGDAVAVTWEVALDDTFADVVRTGQLTSSPLSDHTIHVEVTGLQPATTYHYRFRALGATSPTGRTRTAPATAAEVELLRFGVVSCSNWEGGYFSAYRHVADRDDLDAVIHLGDYVYEYGNGGYGPGATLSPPRLHDPADEMIVLEDYRRRHAQYKTDPDLQVLHHRYAMIATLDDHEVTDNSWRDGAVNHTEGSEGAYVDRRAAAMQAYFEWMPVRRTGGLDEPTRVWRTLRFGSLVDLLMLDERTYRSKQPAGASEDRFVTSAEPGEPDRTMLGPDQLAYLQDSLSGSDATWKLLGNGVMFAPLVLADLPDPASPVNTVLGELGLGSPVVLNGDQWDGYQVEQAALSQAFGEAGGVVILTGDIHSSWAAEIPLDPGVYLAARTGETTAVEFVTPAVTSDSFGASLEGAVGVPGAGELAVALPAVVDAAGPWFKYLDPDRHGYGVLEVTGEHVQYDWHHISDRTDPQATSAFAAAWESRTGTNRLQAAQQLGPRADQVEPAPTTTVPPSDGRLPATGSEQSLVGPAVAALTLAAGAIAVRRRADGVR